MSDIAALRRVWGVSKLTGRTRGSRTSKEPQESYTLGQAAARALDVARREKLALAYVAEREGAPQFWFARNILSVVGVDGRSAGAARSTRLAKGSFERFELDAAMTKLCAPGEAEGRIEELAVPADELKKYLSWARSVQ